MQKPKGVIFDYGGTILHLESTDAGLGNRKLLEFVTNNTDVTAEQLQSTIEDIGNYIFKIADESDIQVRIQEIYRLAFETLELTPSIDYPEMENLWWDTAVIYRPNDGIYDVLDSLDRHKIKTGILSNSGFTGEVMLHGLEKHNLAHRFSFFISTADYGIRKPNKRIFDLAIKKIGLGTAEIWFAGDKVEYDVQGAINSGLFPVFYNWRNESVNIEDEHLIINNWYEFRDKIEELYTG